MKRAIPLIFALAACQFVTPQAASLRDFDPLSAEPDALRAALVPSPGLRLPLGGAELVAYATRSDTGEDILARFVLGATETDALANLAIQPQDYARFTAVRDQITEWKEAAPDATSGSITVTARLCETSPGSGETARISIFMAVAPDAPMVAMVENLPISSAGPEAILASDDPACVSG